MIFQRGNPLDYERWAADPGMETWDYAHCLPYFKRMETCLAGADEWRGGSGPLVLERGPGDQPAVRRVLRGRAAGRPPADRRRQRLPPGGLRALRPQRAPRPPAQRGPRLPAPGDGPPEPRRVETLAHGHRARSSRATGSPASTTTAPGRGDRTVEAGEVILCGGAINSPQLLLLSGIGPKADLEQLGIDVVADLPGVGQQPPGPPRGLHPVRLQAAGLDRPLAQAPAQAADRRRVAVPAQRRRARPTTSRPAASSAATTSVDYPNLMFHFLPIAIRYDGSRPAAEHGYQVHIGPMYSDVRGTRDAQVARPARAPGAAVQLPVDRERPPRVDRDGPRGPAHPQPAGVRRLQRRRALARARRSRPTRRSSTGSREDAETALHPSCTARMGVDDDCRARPGRRCGCTASTGCASSTPRRCPTSPTATSTRPVMMLAEKAADLILGNTPLPPVGRAVLPLPRRTTRSYPPGDRATTQTPQDDDDPDATRRPDVPPAATPRCRSTDLWKIFGATADKIIGTPDADLSRAGAAGQDRLRRRRSRTSPSTSRPGEVFVVMGLSGSGKSTLVRLLTRLIEPTAGTRQHRRRGHHRAPTTTSCASCAATTSPWCSSTSGCCRTAR